MAASFSKRLANQSPFAIKYFKRRLGSALLILSKLPATATKFRAARPPAGYGVWGAGGAFNSEPSGLGRKARLATQFVGYGVWGLRPQ
jgi:hypothetical protein